MTVTHVIEALEGSKVHDELRLKPRETSTQQTAVLDVGSVLGVASSDTKHTRGSVEPNTESSLDVGGDTTHALSRMRGRRQAYLHPH